jgi:Tol biopolymer transport system component
VPQFPQPKNAFTKRETTRVSAGSNPITRNPATLDPATHAGVCSPRTLHTEGRDGKDKMRRSKHLFLALTASALALTAVPASAGVAVTTTRVTVNSAGVPGNARPGDSSNLPISISATGRFVAFSSPHSNLVKDDGNYFDDVFVRDRKRGETTRVSVGSTGAVPNDFSGFPSISANGRFVAFASLASNLVRGDRNHAPDIFVRDRKLGETTRVSVSSAGAEGNDRSLLPAISANGRYVAFFSDSTNLIPNDHNGIGDFFVRDLKRGQTTRISVSSAEEEQTPGPGVEERGMKPAISHNGRFVAFFSPSTNLVPNDHNGTDDIFVRDRKRGETTRVSVSSTGAEGNASSLFFPSISANGRFVAFTSWASNLVAGDENGHHEDVFVRDRKRGVTTRVRENNRTCCLYSGIPSISANGRFVAFEAPASDLVNGDRNDAVDVFLHDRKRGRTTLLSVSSEGKQGNDESSFPSISANGHFVAFSSLASNLVGGDRFNTADTFVRGRLR